MLGKLWINNNFVFSQDIKIKSFVNLKYQHIDKQMAEFSCGIAVLATLLNYYYSTPTKEEDIAYSFFKKMIEKKRGISFLDMKKFALKKGFNAEGYKMIL